MKRVAVLPVGSGVFGAAAGSRRLRRCSPLSLFALFRHGDRYDAGSRYFSPPLNKEGTTE